MQPLQQRTRAGTQQGVLLHNGPGVLLKAAKKFTAVLLVPVTGQKAVSILQSVADGEAHGLPVGRRPAHIHCRRRGSGHDRPGGIPQGIVKIK